MNPETGLTSGLCPVKNHVLDASGEPNLTLAAVSMTGVPETEGTFFWFYLQGLVLKGTLPQ